MTLILQIARTLAIGAVALTSAVVADHASAAKASCVARSADGTGSTKKIAQFQVYEAMLQATDWGVWAAWMASGTTPGYKVKPVKYTCAKGSGLGVTCHGRAAICKL